MVSRKRRVSDLLNFELVSTEIKARKHLQQLQICTRMFNYFPSVIITYTEEKIRPLKKFSQNSALLLLEGNRFPECEVIVTMR